MKMEKKKFRIGELADKVGVKKFVIRFWEKEFGLTSSRSDGGQRFYTEHDLSVFMRIKKLLYEKGFTISGAKKQLNTSWGAIQQPESSQKKENDERLAQKTDWDQEELLHHIVTLKKQLSKLRELL